VGAAPVLQSAAVDQFPLEEEDQVIVAILVPLRNRKKVLLF
jgi:hypothetical protein